MPNELELMYKMAKFYYYNDLKQESIARRLNISKYKVSRELRKAKILGMIQIKIIKPKPVIKKNK